MRQILYFLSFLVFVPMVNGQSNLWTKGEANTTKSLTGYQIQTREAHSFHFDITTFQSMVKKGEELLLLLPVSATDFVEFKLQLNRTMSEGLMAKYPAIRAFDGLALDQSGRTAKIDVGPNYFRAMIFTPGKPDVFIDPAVFNHSLQNDYIVYDRSQVVAQEAFRCELEELSGNDKLLPVDFVAEKAIQSCELRTYRLAIAATGEYTIFHGGTVEHALAAQVTTMNRVNGIYERDLAITMTLVEDNDKIIYTNPQTDPYSNGNPQAMISQNTSVLTDSIGWNNFDIGHVFGTNSGGLASLNSVCNQNKARGVTGSGAPVGDPFDIDYVSHEMGHQFGANHSFNNSCQGNRNNGTAMEPGSGSTIMGYAGICPPNVGNNSDGLFHAISLQEIGTAISSFAHNCPVKTPLNNAEPSLISVPENMIVPSGTPFTLKAEAMDADNDVLTYTFEQMDREISMQPPAANATNGPSFRALMPSEESYRNFPAIQNLISNSLSWEKLSEVSRTYNFRVTVRDNSLGGGCTDYEDFTVEVDANFGPFELLYPSAYGITWTGNTQETITWDVANTTEAPISCENVEILLSQNWGETFETLVESAPNTGSLEITVPNIDVNRAMIMVRSEAGTFFDISNYTFKIVKNTVGLADESIEQLKLYPNPSNGKVQIELNGAEAINGFSILNMAGQVVYEETDKVYSNHAFDISGLAPGVYFFNSILKDRNVVLKVVIE